MAAIFSSEASPGVSSVAADSCVALAACLSSVAVGAAPEGLPSAGEVLAAASAPGAAVAAGFCEQPTASASSTAASGRQSLFISADTLDVGRHIAPVFS